MKEDLELKMNTELREQAKNKKAKKFLHNRKAERKRKNKKKRLINILTYSFLFCGFSYVTARSIPYVLPKANEKIKIQTTSNIMKSISAISRADMDMNTALTTLRTMYPDYYIEPSEDGKKIEIGLYSSDKGIIIIHSFSLN